jgi:hypothetical protein
MEADVVRQVLKMVCKNGGRHEKNGGGRYEKVETYWYRVYEKEGK